MLLLSDTEGVNASTRPTQRALCSEFSTWMDKLTRHAAPGQQRDIDVTHRGRGTQLYHSRGILVSRGWCVPVCGAIYALLL